MPSIQDATQWVGPMVLFLLMTVVGLELTPADFRRVASAPRAVIGGTLAQIALLPLLTWAVVSALGVTPVLAAGAILVAVAPNAGITTLLAALARANVALAVTLTALASVLCTVTLPTIAAFGLRVLLGEAVAIDVPVAALIAQLALSLLLPIGIGMTLRARRPEFVARNLRHLQRAVMIAIGMLIAIAIPFVDTAEMGKLSFTDAPVALVASVVLASAAMGLGWGVARALGLPADDRFTFLIAFTTRNIAVAAIVALSGLGRLDLALWSGFHWVTAYPLAAAAALVRRWITRPAYANPANARDPS
jgi:BASS family bile acid:Na+ symporter